MRLNDRQLEFLIAKTNKVTRSRGYDFVIGENYLLRWWWAPHNPITNAYIHHMYHDDFDRAKHDHPWPSCSIILESGFIELTPEGKFYRLPGDVIFRSAKSLHRLVLYRDSDNNTIPASTLFLTGPRIRTWGFDCPKGWVPWYDFVDARDQGQVGRGCGEYS